MNEHSCVPIKLNLQKEMEAFFTKADHGLLMPIQRKKYEDLGIGVESRFILCKPCTVSKKVRIRLLLGNYLGVGMSADLDSLT